MNCSPILIGASPEFDEVNGCSNDDGRLIKSIAQKGDII